MNNQKLNYSRINMKVLNQSAWVLILMTYALPYRFTDGFETSYGYPFAFLSTHGNQVGLTPLMSMSVNVMVLLVDIGLIYSVLNLFIKKRGVKHE